MTTLSLTRYERMADIIDRAKLDQTPVSIIGCGSIGRKIALELANIGVKNLQIVDFDTVEEVNLGPQGYLEEDVGLSKVSATQKMIDKINKSVNVEVINGKFNNDIKTGRVVFCCVDSITTRKFIIESIAPDLFIDCRMAAESLRVFSVISEDHRDAYIKKSLFAASQAYQGTCTSRSTSYCSTIAAGIAVAQMIKWLRDIEPEYLIDFNILSMELSALGV